MLDTNEIDGRGKPSAQLIVSSSHPGSEETELSSRETDDASPLMSIAGSPTHESYAADQLSNFLQYLLNLPSRSEIIQHLVINTFSEFEAWGACMVLNQEYGVLETASQFGLNPGYRSSLDGIRSSVALQVELDRQLEKRNTWSYPSPLGHSIVGSLFTPHHFLGFIQVFIPETSNLTAASDCMKSICIPMSLLEELHKQEIEISQTSSFHPYANGFNQSPDNAPGNHNESTTDSPETISSGPANLSSRQLRVLELMSIGKTNIGIAEIIGYSESTVRQETMAIYRILSVHNRNAACKVAYELGIIKIEPDIGLAQAT